MDSLPIRCSCGREVAKYKELVVQERSKQIPFLPDNEKDRNLQKIFDDLDLDWCCRIDLTSMMRAPDLLKDIPVIPNPLSSG
jgi:DNA-directed RNA polymerase subunit N (RpoN/RPB10)